MQVLVDKIAELGAVIGLKDGVINRMREETQKIETELAKVKAENLQLKKVVEVNPDS